MLREQCKVGMKVLFGRSNGEQTLGEVIKINEKSVKVKTCENRGNGRGGVPGAMWNVAYAFVKPANPSDVTVTETVKANPTIKYSPFQDPVEQHVMMAIVCCHSRLSPENLTGDGELPRHEVQRRAAHIRRQLTGLFNVMGREVDETTAYEWEREKREYAKRREHTPA